MKGKCGVMAPDKRVAHPSWYVGYQDKGSFRYPAREVWVKRGGTGKTSGSGPTGYKTNPAYMLARSLAERPGVNLAVRKRQEERVLEKKRPIKLAGF